MTIFRVFVASVIGSLIAASGDTRAAGSVRTSKQTVSFHNWETGQNLNGIFNDGEYAGVQFHLVPDVSIPLPLAWRPESLLAKLDPALKVVSVGLPPRYQKTRGEILSALPNTAFRLERLFSADGRMSSRLGEPAVPVYVVGYNTSPCSPPPNLDQLINERFKNDAPVCISGYELIFGELPSCDRYAGLCTLRLQK